MKIAIVDSGINPDHPHICGVAGGIGVTPHGLVEDYVDRLGHGTAVAAAIQEKVGADADLFAVKVFGNRLSATVDMIVLAMNWCVEQQMDLVNLSFGSANLEHRKRFEQILSHTPLVVAAAHTLPGDLPGVITVAADENCARDCYFYRDGIFHASPFPRPIPSVHPRRNLNGVSFAVANMSGLVARLLTKTRATLSNPLARDQFRAELIKEASY